MRINSISINGNLTSDPEGKELPNQNYMARFSIAHNDREKKGDEWVAVAHFFDCLAWGKPAKILCDQVRKGDPIAVTGTLKQERWEKDGEKHQRVRINVTGWVVGKRKDDASGGGGAKAVNDDDDIRF